MKSLPTFHHAEGDENLSEDYVYDSEGHGVRRDLVEKVLTQWAELQRERRPSPNREFTSADAWRTLWLANLEPIETFGQENIARIAVATVATELAGFTPPGYSRALDEIYLARLNLAHEIHALLDVIHFCETLPIDARAAIQGIIERLTKVVVGKATRRLDPRALKTVAGDDAIVLTRDQWEKENQD